MTCNEWCAQTDGANGCFAPVPDWDSAPAHLQNCARETVIHVDGVLQSAPTPPAALGAHSDAIRRDWGIAGSIITQFIERGVI